MQQTSPTQPPCLEPGHRFARSSRTVPLLAVFLALLMLGCGQEPMVAGNRYLAKGDYGAALIEFKNAVQAEPASLPARLALADAYEHAFEPTNAEQQLRKALELGGDANLLVPRVVTLMLDRNELESLIREFKDRHLDAPQAENHLRALLAMAYLSQRRVAQAEQQLQGLQTDTAAVRLAKAQLWLTQGQAPRALAELETLPNDATPSWWTQRALSRVYNAVGRGANALNAIQKAHEMAPWHRGLTGEYAQALVAAGQLAQAEALRDRLLQTAPNYFWTHYLNAIILASQGHKDESHAAALKVLNVAPDHLPAAMLAASAELQSKDFSMAENRLKKVLQQDPDSIAALQMLAIALTQSGQPHEAEEILRRGLALRPTDARLLSLQSDLAMQRGDTQQALLALETLVATYPQDTPGLLRLSELKARLGRAKEATALLDRAAALGQDDPVLRDQMVSIAMRKGDGPRVRRLADHAMQTQPKAPQSHLVLAAAQAYQHDAEGAWRSTLAALDLRPGFDAALMALSNLARTPVQRQELRRRFEAALASKTNTPATYLAFVALLRADAADAADPTLISQWLEKAVHTHPESTPLRSALVQENLRQGNADAALSVAQTGAAVTHAPAAATALLAQTYERTGKTQLATETYRKLVSNYPQRTDWRLKLATLEAADDRLAQASTLLRGLITERPFDSAAYVALARMVAPDNLREALSIARELGGHAPHKPMALLLEGDLLAQADKPREALTLFTQAAKSGAEPTASLRIVALLDHTQRGPAADEEMSRLLGRFPNDSAVLGYAAHRALAQGQHDKALAWLQKLAGKHPRNPVALNDLAWAQIQAKDPQAIHTARKALQWAPDDPNILDTLGMAQALAGQRDDALLSLRTAINLAPAAALPRLHLAELQLAGGDRKAAGATLGQVNEKSLTSGDHVAWAALSKRMRE